MFCYSNEVDDALHFQWVVEGPHEHDQGERSREPVTGHPLLLCTVFQGSEVDTRIKNPEVATKSKDIA